jgi:hypothetical protein
VSGVPELPEAFYRDLGGGRYETTAATAGPWSRTRSTAVRPPG